jgi:hypothetical protein
MAKTRKIRRRQKRTRRRLRGGDYRMFTNETVGGVAVNNRAVVTVPGHGVMTLKEFKDYLETI